MYVYIWMSETDIVIAKTAYKVKPNFALRVHMLTSIQQNQRNWERPRRLIAIVSLDLFTALIAIVSSKFIHLPGELVNQEWKIHFQLVTRPLMTEGLAGKSWLEN